MRASCAHDDSYIATGCTRFMESAYFSFDILVSATGGSRDFSKGGSSIKFSFQRVLPLSSVLKGEGVHPQNVLFLPYFGKTF